MKISMQYGTQHVTGLYFPVVGYVNPVKQYQTVQKHVSFGTAGAYIQRRM